MNNHKTVCHRVDIPQRTTFLLFFFFFGAFLPTSFPILLHLLFHLLLIAIAPRSTQAQRGSTWYGPIYGLNRTNCIFMQNWTVWLNWIAWNRNVFDNFLEIHNNTWHQLLIHVFFYHPPYFFQRIRINGKIFLKVKKKIFPPFSSESYYKMR